MPLRLRSERGRRRSGQGILREIFFTLALLAGAWTLWLVVVGGIDTTLFGVSITSNEPVRPFLLATIALALYIWSGDGFARVRDKLWAATAALDERPAAAAIALAVLATGLSYGTTVASGSDAYGYVSEADLWLSGNLKVEQPWVADLPWPNARWTAAPLGYRPIEAEGQWAIVPTYSPGLPLMMAVTKGIFGHGAVFWIVPLSTAVLVLATFGIGRRLGSARAGLIAAWLVATSPIVLFMTVPPMTDVPVAAAWTLAFFFAARAGARAALAAGLAAAVAILIRPNLAVLALPIGVWIGARRRADAIAFGGAILAGVIAVAAIFARLYGSPFVSGYGSLGDAFGWANVWPNIRNYTAWFVESQTPLGLVGLAAVLLPVRRVWSWVTDRAAVLAMTAIVALVIVQYVTYLTFDTWWFLRFFLPAWPYLCLGLASVFLIGLHHSRSVVALATLWVVVALGLFTVRSASKLGTFDAWEGDRTAVDVAQVVAHEIDSRSVVFTRIHSGSLRYYGGRMTLRFESLDRDWLDRAVAWLTDHGVHAYALLDKEEAALFQDHFRGQRAADELAREAVLNYRGPATIVLYDLARVSDVKPREVPRRDPVLFHAVAPVPAPGLSFKPR